MEGVQDKRRSYRERDDDEGSLSGDLAAVNERLDELTQQLERLGQTSADRRRAGASGVDERHSAQVADALARLDHRLDQVIGESRAAERESDRRSQSAPPPPPQPSPPAPVAPARDPANWAAQITARQRALDGGIPATAAPEPPPVASASAAAQPKSPSGPDPTELHRPCEQAFEVLRRDLAGIGRMLTEAMPRQAITRLEAEVRALAEQLDRTRQAGADDAALATLEAGIAEVRDALRGLAPAEGAVGLKEAVQALSHKIDRIAASAAPAQDPIALKQLEQAVVSLRGAVSNVASDGALAQLAAEVHALAGQFERTAADSSTDALARLEARIVSLMESDRAVPPALEDSIHSLSGRIDRMQLSQGDQLALGALEDRIAKLSEKLDASDARLKHFGAIEVGLADLLVYLEEMRNGGPRGLRAAAPEEPERPAPLPAAAPSAPSPLDMIPELPQPEAPVETVQAPAPAPASSAPPPIEMTPPPAAATMASQPPAEIRPPQAAAQAQPAPRNRERPPIDPNLPPDTPLEPGSGTPRVKPGSPAARIAASEAALGNARPRAAETGGKAAAIAAARLAVKAAFPDTPVKAPGSFRSTVGNWFKWPSKKTSKVLALPPPTRTPEPANDIGADLPPSGGKRVLPRLKKLLLAASVAIIVIGTAQTALEMLVPDQAATPPTVEVPNSPPAPTVEVPNSPPPPSAPMRSVPTPEGTLPSAPAADPGSTGGTDRSPMSFDPSIVVPPATVVPPTTVMPPEPPRADVTGSIEQPPLPRPAPAQAAQPAGQPTTKAVPAAIGPVLGAAVASNDPAAEYELGARYSEGRGVRQDLQEAVRWLERAADAGFAPAQFRLASLNEKGEGLKKDLPAARRLYLAAAGQGHAKAMHNLAVLYAEGIDDKPDYKAAAQWFRKAAGYGVADSQYNLAILYARGIGVQSNLAESYKWFALAAAQGDRDAAQKRDDVASRLDRQTMMAAKLAVQTFVPEREPEEATSLRVPPGGWDRATTTPVKPRPQHPRQHRG